MAFRNIPPNGFPAIPDIEDLEAVVKDVSTLKSTTAALAEDVGDLEDQKANQITIALPFNPESEYEVGDLVYYNGLSYRCTNAHTGEWDADDFAGTTIANELASLKSGLTDLGNITKNIVIGEYTTFYDALRSFTDGVRYCGFWSINNYTDKPTGTTNSANYALFFNTSTAYYYGKILLFSAGDVYLGYFATDTATAITWTKLAVAA